MAQGDGKAEAEPQRCWTRRGAAPHSRGMYGAHFLLAPTMFKLGEAQTTAMLETNQVFAGSRVKGVSAVKDVPGAV